MRERLLSLRSTAGFRSRLSWSLEILTGFVCATLVAKAALFSPLDHNEEMYVAAARLMPEMRLYSDFAFLQAPLLPMTNAVLFVLIGYKNLLLAARLHAMFWGLIAVVGMYAIAVTLTRHNRLAASSAALALASQRLFLDVVAESSNYIMPLALAILCFQMAALALSGGYDPKPSLLLAAFSGLLLGLAISCKSFYLLLVPGIVASFALAATQRFLPAWILGIGLGIAPALFYFIGDPGPFYFGNLQYHMLNAAYRRETGWPGPLTLTARVSYLASLWKETLPLLATLYVTAAAAFIAVKNGVNTLRHNIILASYCTLALAVVAALSPTPSFDQYFALPIAFLVIATIAAAGQAGSQWQLALVLLFALALASAPATRRLTVLPDSTVPERFAFEARRFGSEVACSAHTYVATLSPILPLEAGCRVYAELATGPFAFRVADRQLDSEQAVFRIVGPRRLNSLLDAKPPQAIYVGFEGRLDRHFEKFARDRGYTRLDSSYFNRGRVWVAPGRARSHN